MKIEFGKTGGPYGDATCNYEVDIPENTTVREFIKYIVEEYSVEHGEWGDIRVITPKDSHFGVGAHIIDYKRGEVESSDVTYFKRYADRVIRKVRANGGWSSMSYYLYLEEEK